MGDVREVIRKLVHVRWSWWPPRVRLVLRWRGRGCVMGLGLGQIPSGWVEAAGSARQPANR